MNRIFFSIITVCYNSEKTIERTIQSVLNQSFVDYEYILIDGQSEDGTLSIIKKYSSLFGIKMRILSEPDSGIYNAMNKGINMATGNFIGIVNSDDWLENNALDVLYEYITINALLHERMILTGWMNFHYESGRIQLFKSDNNQFMRYIHQYRLGINHPATFVSRIVYDKIGLFDEKLKLHADTDLIIRSFLDNVLFVFVEKILVNMSDGGASNKYDKQSFIDRKLILRRYSKDKMEYLFLLVGSWVRFIMKKMVPSSFLVFYRSK